MALSAEQKVQIVSALGIPPSALNPNSTNYSKTIVDRLNVIDGPSETIATSRLATIAAIDAKLNESIDRAGVKRVGDIEINPMEQDILRRERNKVIKDLANLCDLAEFRNTSSIMGSIVV